jgi:hypothetical protein
MNADPKQGKRIVDTTAVRRALLTYPYCAACGRPAGSAHHVIQKGAPHFGDDVIANIVGLCGTGTMRCHGAYHGSPYYHALPGLLNGRADTIERRDTEWVARRIGKHLLAARSDVIEYVIGKLGVEFAAVYLNRFYYLDGVVEE